MFAFLLIPAGLLIGYGYIYLYRFSHAISDRFKRQPAAVGFIILSALTSIPEMTSVVYSLQKEYSSVPLAAVSGSNVFNFTMLLACVLWRYSIKFSSISREEDLWAQVFVAFIVFLNFLFVPSVHTVTFLVLLVIFIIYGYLVRKSILRNQNEKVFFNVQNSKTPSRFSFTIGIVMTIVGSILLVESALSLSSVFSISDSAISTAVIGSFTSIPELLLFFYLQRKNWSSIAISTLTGSGVFNWIMVLIIPMYIFHYKIDTFLNIRCVFSAYFFAIIAMYFYFLYRKNKKVKRIDSLILIGVYTFYIIWNFYC